MILGDRLLYRLTPAFVMLALLAAASCRAAVITDTELKAKVQEATKDFKDISMLGTVTYKNKKALAKIDANYARLYDFKAANVAFKEPDKLRMDGKLGMVKFQYVINGGLKIIRAPTIRFTKKEDYSADPAKLQDALDVGLVTVSLWRNRRVEVLDDPEAATNGEIKLQLHWPKGEMVLYAWIDAKDLWLKKFEKRNPAGELLLRVVYSNPRKAGGAIWMPTTVEVFASDGERVGASEYSDIKANTGLEDSYFE